MKKKGEQGNERNIWREVKIGGEGSEEREGKMRRQGERKRGAAGGGAGEDDLGEYNNDSNIKVNNNKNKTHYRTRFPCPNHVLNIKKNFLRIFQAVFFGF